MKKCLLKLFVLLLASAPAFAQTVTGRVTNSADGTALPGVSVLVKGTTTGTTTDTDGKFSISAGPSETLVVSFIGFATQDVPVGSKSSIEIILNEDITQLGEVVVTALGIEREKKSLGYSVQEVSGASFTQARESNVINNLQGRVAGVQIYKGGTGPGGSSRIVIRGSNSLRGADGPMFVVDGVPFDNYNTSTGTSEYGSTDLGQGISQINPDDIESMTVLKGAEAGALYGNRGANGVILITTKKGKARKGLGVNYNSNMTFDSPLVLPDVQNTYGQGANGLFVATSGSSWGPKATGQSITDWTGKARPMTIDPNDLKNFLQTGRSFTNSLDLSGGDEKSTFRLGYTNYDNKGLVPTSTLKRNMLTLRATHNITSKLSADVKISYSKQEGHNRPATSGSAYNVFNYYANTPRSIQFSDMEQYKDANGLMRIWLPSSYSTIKNPYWVNNENSNNDKTERLLTMVKLDYKFNDWLRIFARHGIDQTHQYTERSNAWGMGNPTDPSSFDYESGYNQGRSEGTETNSDFLITATKTFSDLRASLSIGGNRRNNASDWVGGSTNTLVFPGFYNLSGGTNPRPYSGKQLMRVNSVYSFLNLGYKEFLYLDASFRNDWSSTVSKKNRSFHYPSVSASAIISDMVQLPTVISYFKVRGGFAQTGNTVDPYQLSYTFAVAPAFNNAQTAHAPDDLLNPDILPEKVNSIEIGTDIKLWNNRLGLEFAYYDKSTTNQIVKLPLLGGTGFKTRYINAGNVTNKGFEFVINGSPVKTSSFEWNIAVNYNHNVNKVEKLVEGFNRYFLQSDVNSRAVRVVADEGKPMGDLYGRDFKRDSKGNIVVDANGVPEKAAEKNSYLGNYQPKYTAGIINSLSYKGITLGFLIDMRMGGKIYSQSLASMHANGNAAGTLAYREGGMIVNGVNEDGSKNTKAITSQQYWQAVAGVESVASQFIYDASNVRLREATLSYSLPANMISKTPFSKVSIGFVGRNLWLISSHIPGVDPESTFSVTNSQGIENSAYPSYRSYGFNLNLGF
jgi:TonB-linked SusC/RagA family outer membrane protein